MTGDQRLFVYPLDLQLQRLRWRLDAQLAELAQAITAIEALRADGKILDAEASDIALDSARAQARRLDPQRARQALDYLSGLHQRLAVIDTKVLRAESDLRNLREMLARTQGEIEKLESDRGERLSDHLRDVDRRLQGEADQDWTARSAWRQCAARQEERLS
ncbi:MAG: hypothetical protein ABJD97_00955 [Betaproteobacteria bacterium]